MLYNPKWEVKADPLSLSSLIRWLESKDPNEHYCYVSNGECLIAQYFSFQGFKGINVSPQHVFHSDGYVRLPIGFNDIALPHGVPCTFGAALTRARALLIEKRLCGA